MKVFDRLLLPVTRCFGAVMLLVGCTLTQSNPVPNVASQKEGQPTTELASPDPTSLAAKPLASTPSVPGATSGQTPPMVPQPETPGQPPATTRPGNALLPTPQPLVQPGMPTAVASPASVIENPPSGWQVYRNSQYGFEVYYPSSYVILPPLPPEPAMPQPLFEVLFQDQAVATVDVERIEPPAFAVRVFDNRARQSLDSWLNTHVFSTGRQNLDVMPYPSGLKVCTRLMIAPGCFIYLAHADYIYQLTPLGELAEQMAASFRVIP